MLCDSPSNVEGGDALVELDDEVLIRRSARGDEQAFARLVRRYEYQVAMQIRYLLNNAEDAEDILQETLLDAWAGISRLRDPGKFRAWLLQIARNRCRDFHRSTQRRDLPTERGELEQIVSRSSLTQAHQRKILADLLDTLEEIPPAERVVAKGFYLKGFTIAEIATRHNCPEGTVKRRLFHARNHLRRTLGIAERRSIMSKNKRELRKRSLPLHRPEVVITEIDMQPFSVDCRELNLRFIVPELGEHTLSASYHAPDWKRNETEELRVVKPALVHGVEGVEIEVKMNWESCNIRTIYGCLTEDSVRYLATIYEHEGTMHLLTFLDGEHYIWAWPETPRRLEDTGRYIRQEDGSYKQVHSSDSEEASGAGIFSVNIGGREFTCLRVIQPEGNVRDVHAPFHETYVTQEGRTVLNRVYCHDCYSKDIPVDKGTRLVIDDETRYHWYDTLTNCSFDF